MISSETVWASLGAVASACVVKLVDKWIKRSEQRNKLHEKEEFATQQDRMAELNRLKTRIEILEKDVDRWREQHFNERQTSMEQAVEIKQLKSDLQTAHTSCAECWKKLQRSSNGGEKKKH